MIEDSEKNRVIEEISHFKYDLVSSLKSFGVLLCIFGALALILGRGFSWHFFLVGGYLDLMTLISGVTLLFTSRYVETKFRFLTSEVKEILRVK